MVSRSYFSFAIKESLIFFFYNIYLRFLFKNTILFMPHLIAARFAISAEFNLNA